MTVEERDTLYKEAEKQTPGTIGDFLEKLGNMQGSYSDTPDLIAIGAVAASWALNGSPMSRGGITGFQAGWVMWQYIRHWFYTNNKTGLKLVDYDNMLFPQYEDKFDKVISMEIWDNVKKEAKDLLENHSDGAHPNVIKHWQSIVDGNLPFGFRIEN